MSRLFLWLVFIVFEIGEGVVVVYVWFIWWNGVGNVFVVCDVGEVKVVVLFCVIVLFYVCKIEFVFLMFIICSFLVLWYIFDISSVCRNGESNLFSFVYIFYDVYYSVLLCI